MNWIYSFIFYIIPFNIFWDFLSIFYKERAGPLAIVRGLILLFFVLSVFSKFKKNSITESILIFIVYITFLFPISTDIFSSIQVSSKIFLTLLMMPVGYSLIRSKSAMDRLNKNIFLVYIILIVGFVTYNLFDFGGYVYVDVGFQSGGLSDNWNVITYSLLLAPLFLNLKPTIAKKYLFYFFFITLLIILVISFKRIAITGFIFGYLVYFYKYGNYKKSIQSIILVTIVLVSLSPFYIDAVLMKYEFRKEQLLVPDMIENSGRFLETYYIWEEILSFENPIKSIFGCEAFNTVGLYAGGAFKNRTAHVDYNLILFSNGIIGLLLYLNIYFQAYIKFKKILVKKNTYHNKMYSAVFCSLFFTSLFTSLSGQMYAITFRSIAFFYMGSILGLLSWQRQS